MTIPLIDAHAHLADERLEMFRGTMALACAKHHVTHVLINAALPEEWPVVVQLSRQTPFYGALGLHPFFPEHWSKDLLAHLRETIANAPENSKIVAIGEIGLDAWNSREHFDIQREQFCRQLELAVELKLPVALHNRKTWSDFFEIVKAHGIRRLRGYCHHFTGSPEVLEKLLSLGLLVSFCGPATHPNARRIHEAIRVAPPECILTETDCPDLPPIQANSKESRPWHTRFVLNTIAQLKQIPEADLALRIQTNFKQLFIKTEENETP
ncbi:MAG: TatD family hydrolase [Victivallales bacterium]|nr:TatD family hydrolase [Victivallales bacterium]